MIALKPLEWINGNIRFLDQTKLPLEEVYIKTDDVAVVADAIKRLAIRGAPLIGIAAAYGVALASLQLKETTVDEIRSHLQSTIDILASARPTAVNLFWALKRQRCVLDAWQTNSVAELQKRLLDEALLIHREDFQMCERISSLVVELLPQS